MKLDHLNNLAGHAALFRHRGPAWMPFPLLPAGDSHDDDADDDADDDDAKDDKADDAKADDAKDGADKGDLGDAGKQALDRMKAQRNAAKAELRAFKALGITPEQVAELLAKGEDGDDDEDVDDKPKAGTRKRTAPKVDVEKIRADARAEVRRERVVDKIEAKAGNRFALDPEDVAALLLRRSKIDDFLDGDSIDIDAIEEALDELLADKPNLAAQGGRRFQGGGDQGTRNGSKKSQLTREDLAKLSPAERLKAFNEGRCADVVAGKK